MTSPWKTDGKNLPEPEVKQEKEKYMVLTMKNEAVREKFDQARESVLNIISDHEEIFGGISGKAHGINDEIMLLFYDENLDIVQYDNDIDEMDILVQTPLSPNSFVIHIHESYDWLKERFEEAEKVLARLKAGEDLEAIREEYMEKRDS